jgi:hypothetical protein
MPLPQLHGRSKKNAAEDKKVIKIVKYERR